MCAKITSASSGGKKLRHGNFQTRVTLTTYYMCCCTCSVVFPMLRTDKLLFPAQKKNPHPHNLLINSPINISSRSSLEACEKVCIVLHLLLRAAPLANSSWPRCSSSSSRGRRQEEMRSGIFFCSPSHRRLNPAFAVKKSHLHKRELGRLHTHTHCAVLCSFSKGGLYTRPIPGDAGKHARAPLARPRLS